MKNIQFLFCAWCYCECVKHIQNMWLNNRNLFHIAKASFVPCVVLVNVPANVVLLTAVCRQAGGEIQAGQQQRCWDPEEQSEEPRQRTATCSYHQQTGRRRLCAGNAHTRCHQCPQSVLSSVFTAATGRRRNRRRKQDKLSWRRWNNHPCVLLPGLMLHTCYSNFICKYESNRWNSYSLR